MPTLDYEIIAKLMSYVFTFLGLLIVFRSFIWLRKDQIQTRKRLKALPDAGAIGLLTVLRGSSELPEGTVLSVPSEGVLGFVRSCDVVVPVDQVVARHLDFSFREGHGLYVYPRRGCPVHVDEVPVESHQQSREQPMLHGSVLRVGDAVLQLGVFAGLRVDNCPTQWRMAGDELVSADALPAVPAMDETPLFQPWQPPLGAFPPRPLPPEMYLPVMQEEGRPDDEE